MVDLSWIMGFLCTVILMILGITTLTASQKQREEKKKTLLNPVFGEILEDFQELLHYLRNWDVRDLFESPLLGSSTNNSTISVTGTARNRFHGTLQYSVLPWPMKR